MMANYSEWEREMLAELKTAQMQMVENLRILTEQHRLVCEDTNEIKMGVINIRDVLLKVVFVCVGVIAAIATGEKIAGMLLK